MPAQASRRADVLQGQQRQWLNHQTAQGHPAGRGQADGIDQPKVSRVLAGYSTERLMGFLTALGRDVEIVVRTPPRRRRQGRLRVIAA